MRRLTYLLMLLLVVGLNAPLASAKKRPRDVLGLKIGMTEEAVHKHLRRRATQQKEEKEKEEEGEQEIWSLKKDELFDYVLTRFNREHRLTLITVVARAIRVKYRDIGEANDATVASDGRNFSYKWKVDKDGKRKGYLLIARGSSPEFLTSYSLYPTKQ